MIILLKISDEMTEKNVEEFHNKKYRLPYKLGGGALKNNTILKHIIQKQHVKYGKNIMMVYKKINDYI